MAAALFAFLAAVLAGTGARDQVLVASLTALRGRSWLVLALALGAAWVSTFVAVKAAGLIAIRLNNHAAMLLAALALSLGALSMAIGSPRPALKEPTHSLGAAGAALLAIQLSDATRFLIFAIAIAEEAPRQALLGGATGSMAVLAAGWLGGEELLELPLKPARRLLAALLALIAAWLVFQAATV